MTVETRRLRIPYPSDGQDPYYPAFEAMVKAIDAVAFSDVSNRNTLFYGGGDVTWQFDATLTFSEPIVFVEPTYGQVQVMGPPASPISIPSGHFLFTDLSRGNTSSVDLEPLVSSAVPTNINSTILAWHNPSDNTLIWRSGARQIAGQVLGGVGNSSAPSNSEYILARRDVQLPNSRTLSAGAGLEVDDGGALGQFKFALLPSGVTAGRYEFATLEVDQYGRVTLAEGNDPNSVNQRTFFVSQEPTGPNFRAIKVGVGLRALRINSVPDADSFDFIDDQGNTDTAMAMSWVSNQATALSPYELVMRYPFTVPLDALSYGDANGVLIKICFKGNGVLVDAELRVSIKLDNATYHVIKVAQSAAKVYKISISDFPDLITAGLRPGARGIVSVGYANQANIGTNYEATFGPIDVAFINYIRP